MNERKQRVSVYLLYFNFSVCFASGDLLLFYFKYISFHFIFLHFISFHFIVAFFVFQFYYFCPVVFFFSNQFFLSFCLVIIAKKIKQIIKNENKKKKK